jgi:hypothetical protein
VLLTYVSRVQYSCDVVLVFWFWREIVFGITYVLSVQHRQSHFNFPNIDSKKISTRVSLLKRNNLLAKLYFS